MIPESGISTLTDGSAFYREFPPSAHLAGRVECYWTVTSAGPVTAPVLNRVLPDGCIDIIFNLGDSLVTPGGSRQAMPAYVCGAMRSARISGMAGRVDLFGVRFKPGESHPFLRVPADHLTDSVFSLDEFWKESGVSIESIAEAGNIAGRISILERHLTAMLCRYDLPDSDISNAVSLIRRQNGLITVASIEEALGTSRRQLQRRFAERVGLSPKLFCRIVRYRAIIASLRGQTECDWFDHILAGGYYDQAHMIRDFQSLSGISPGSFLREQNDVRFLQYSAEQLK